MEIRCYFFSVIFLFKIINSRVFTFIYLFLKLIPLNPNKSMDFVSNLTPG